MAQYFTQERSLAAATPQIVDDTNRLVKEADEALSRLQAVQDYETKQKANLITNLRSIREYEKGLNTRNHQMMMQNVKQIADIQQRNDRVVQADKQLAAREKAAQEERTMKAIGGIIQGVGQAYQGAVQMAEEQVQAASQEQIANQKAEQEKKLFQLLLFLNKMKVQLLVLRNRSRQLSKFNLRKIPKLKLPRCKVLSFQVG